MRKGESTIPRFKQIPYVTSGSHTMYVHEEFSLWHNNQVNIVNDSQSAAIKGVNDATEIDL